MFDKWTILTKSKQKSFESYVEIFTIRNNEVKGIIEDEAQKNSGVISLETLNRLKLNPEHIEVTFFGKFIVV